MVQQAVPHIQEAELDAKVVEGLNPETATIEQCDAAVKLLYADSGVDIRVERTPSSAKHGTDFYKLPSAMFPCVLKTHATADLGVAQHFDEQIPEFQKIVMHQPATDSHGTTYREDFRIYTNPKSLAIAINSIAREIGTQGTADKLAALQQGVAIG